MDSLVALQAKEVLQASPKDTLRKFVRPSGGISLLGKRLRIMTSMAMSVATLTSVKDYMCGLRNTLPHLAKAPAVQVLETTRRNTDYILWVHPWIHSENRAS